jgi:hypothetical protein
MVLAKLDKARCVTVLKQTESIEDGWEEVVEGGENFFLDDGSLRKPIDLPPRGVWAYVLSDDGQIQSRPQGDVDSQYSTLPPEPPTLMEQMAATLAAMAKTMGVDAQPLERMVHTDGNES